MLTYFLDETRRVFLRIRRVKMSGGIPPPIFGEKTQKKISPRVNAVRVTKSVDEKLRSLTKPGLEIPTNANRVSCSLEKFSLYSAKESDKDKLMISVVWNWVETLAFVVYDPAKPDECVLCDKKAKKPTEKRIPFEEEFLLSEVFLPAVAEKTTEIVQAFVNLSLKICKAKEEVVREIENMPDSKKEILRSFPDLSERYFR